MSWIDAQGKEHKAIIAAQDTIVHDEALGFDRQIIAGQPVPPELISGYKDAAGISQEETDEVAGDEQTKVAQGRKRPSSKSAVDSDGE